jgi:predicted phosphodiesterase
MKAAIISDIHANATALRLVLNDVAKWGVQRIFCLGDVVGFHTEPGECIDLLQEHEVQCIAGNHDAGVTGKLGKEKFPHECWEAIEWTRGQLNDRQMKFLRSLSTQAVVDHTFWMMHGIFGDVYHYLVGDLRLRVVATRLKLSRISVGFYGHTHRQMCAKLSNRLLSFTIEEIAQLDQVNLVDRATYLINPGTVGQPRSKDARAFYAIVDTDHMMVRFLRIGYDYDAVVRKTLSVFPAHARLYARFHSTESEVEA